MINDIEKLLNRCICKRIITEDDIWYDGYFKCSKCGHRDDSMLSWVEIGENKAIKKVLKLLKKIGDY